MQVKIDPLKQVLQVENAITTTLEDFDLVVEPFDKSTGLALNKIIGNFLPPGLQQLQETIKTMQAAFLDLPDPAPEFRLGLLLGNVHLKDGGEAFSKRVSLFGGSGVLEEACQRLAFFLVQVPGVFAKGMHTAFECLVSFRRQFFLQTM